MQAQAILIVGARGTGKTTKSKQLLSIAHPEARLVFDVYGDYVDLYPRAPIPFKDFVKVAMQVKNAVILIEETTIYLNNRGFDGDVVDLLVKLRNNNNTVILVYHSLRSIPVYIYQLTNKVILHKTVDNADDLLKRFDDPELVKVFEEVKNMPWNDNAGTRYSPSKVYKIF